MKLFTLKNLLILLLFIGCNSIYGQTSKGLTEKYIVRNGIGITPSNAVKINGLAIGPTSSILMNKNQAVNGVLISVIGIGLLNPLATLMRDRELQPYFDFKKDPIKLDSLFVLRENADTNLFKYSYKGAVVSGTGVVTGVVDGLIISLWSSLVEDMNGVSINLFLNWNEDLNGIGVGIFNKSYSVKGVQIGLFNKTVKLRGIQIGLWNKSLKRSLPFINWNLKKT